MTSIAYQKTTDVRQLAAFLAHNPKWPFAISTVEGGLHYFLEKRGTILVAKCENRVVGSLGFSIRNYFGWGRENRDNCGWIGYAAIEEQYQGSPIFRTLFQRALTELENKSVRYVGYEVDARNKRMKANYARAAQMIGYGVARERIVIIGCRSRHLAIHKNGISLGENVHAVKLRMEILESYQVPVTRMLDALKLIYPNTSDPFRPPTHVCSLSGAMLGN